jgi:RNA polymerase sigma factor for flagellar operon FliA
MNLEPVVASYLPLVGAIARVLGKGLPPSVDHNDLVHDGVIGLIDALRRYDPARKVTFATFAGHRIKGAMLDGLRARDPLPRQARRAQKAAAGNPPPWARGIQILDLGHAIHLPADEATNPESIAVEADLRRRVREGLAALPPRDREVVILRLVQGLPLRAVAERLSLSMTRTAEIQARGLLRLRRFLDGEPMVRRRGREGRGASTALACVRRQEETRASPKCLRALDDAAAVAPPAPLLSTRAGKDAASGVPGPDRP